MVVVEEKEEEVEVVVVVEEVVEEVVVVVAVVRLAGVASPPRCTALKSAAESDLDSPPALEDAAPPPNPMRYAGPPTLTTHMPGSGSPFLARTAGIWPRPAENMIGLSHSRRSPDGRRMPKERLKPGWGEGDD